MRELRKGEFEAVSVTITAGYGGDVSREHLERQFGLLPATVEAVTGGAGCHLRDARL